MGNSRTAKSLANITTTVIDNFIIIFTKLLVRTVFIYFLPEEYLGLNGLFSSILSMLSLADLGFGIALPYSLYKPLAEKDEKKIKSIMNFFSKVYIIVGLVILLVGASLIPFLPYIIKDIPHIPNIKLIYMLYVINSSSSYFFIYKKTIIIADQKGYQVKLIESISVILTSILQILIIILTRDYILYLIIAIAVTLIQNIYISYHVNNLYPYLKASNVEMLNKEERKELSKNNIVIFFYKIANVVESAIDNIIISTFIGLHIVGLYSNYLLIVGSLKNLLMTATNSITSSVGNVATENNTDKSYLLFKTINTLSVMLYGIVAITIYIMVNSFVVLWVGNEYLIELPTVFVLCLNFYIFGSQNTLATFRNAYGLFWEGRFRPVLMSVENIIFSLLLVKQFGLAGVIIGTIMSRIFSVGIIDSYVIYKNIFNKNVINYHLMKIIHLAIVLLVGITVNYISGFIIVKGILSFIFKGIFVVLITTVCFLLVFWRSEEVKYFKSLLFSLIKQRKYQLS